MEVISRDKFVKLEYRLRLDSGEYLRGSAEAPETLTFIAGYAQLMPALERRLVGARQPDSLEFVIPAAEGFGLYDPESVQVWSRKSFPAEMDLQPGQKVVPANLPFAPEYPLTIKEVKENSVVLDLNHPLAGHDLHYSIRVAEVRDATPEELEPVQQCQSCKEDMECSL